MNAAVTDGEKLKGRLDTAQRLTSLVSWLLAGALFLTVGWAALRPDDPLAPVGLLTHRSPLGAWVQCAGLAAVAAGLATVIAGRLLPNVGTFAACLGLAALSVQGDSASFFLLNGTGEAPWSQQVLALCFVVELVAWAAIFVIASGSSWLLGRWLGIAAPGSPVSFGVLLGDRSRFVSHVGVATAVCFAMALCLSSGLHARAIHHGQSCFIVAGSVLFASYVAFRRFSIPSAVGICIAPLLAATLGYLIASFQSVDATLPPGVPTSHFLRILPMQFVFVGAAAAIVGHWWSDGSATQPAPSHS